MKNRSTTLPLAASETVSPTVEASVSHADLYPNYLQPIVGGQPCARPADAFDVLREQMLLAYGYHTARAYWRDLEDWRDWCAEHTPMIDPLGPRSQNVASFLGERLQGGYSPGTVARRRTALGLFFDLVRPTANPARTTAPVSHAIDPCRTSLPSEVGP